MSKSNLHKDRSANFYKIFKGIQKKFIKFWKATFSPQQHPLQDKDRTEIKYNYFIFLL